MSDERTEACPPGCIHDQYAKDLEELTKKYHGKMPDDEFVYCTAYFLGFIMVMQHVTSFTVIFPAVMKNIEAGANDAREETKGQANDNANLADMEPVGRG